MVTSRERTRVALLDKFTYSVGPLQSVHKPIPYKDRKRIWLRTIIYSFVLNSKTQEGRPKTFDFVRQRSLS